MAYLHMELLALLRKGRGEDSLLTLATWPELLRREIIRGVRERGKGTVVEREDLSSRELPPDGFFKMRPEVVLGPSVIDLNAPPPPR